MFSINQQAIDDGGSTYYTDAYQTMIESHLTWLTSHPQTYSVSIEPNDTLKYQGDLYGLLLAYNVPPRHHWSVMRMNGMSSTTDYDPSMTSLLIPNYEIIASLYAVFVTTLTRFG